MVTDDKGESLNYEQLLEMISAFQWLPDEKRFRLALQIDRNHGTGNQIFGCLLHYAAAIERLERRGALTAAEIQVFLIKLAERYELVQWVDGDSVVMEVKRLVQAIGVDIVMIGKGNAFVTAFVLVMRRAVPLEWNQFCDYVEKLEWKVPLSQSETQSRSDYVADNPCAEPVCEPLVTSLPIAKPEGQPVAGNPRGLASAFENQKFAAAADAILNSCRDDWFSGEETDSILSSAPSAPGPQAVQRRTKWGFGKFVR